MVERNTYHLLLGGNLAETVKKFKATLSELSAFGVVKAQSKIYTSEPWGYESKNEFKNQALSFESELPPFELLKRTQTIEKNLGRSKTQSKDYSDRVIDIDILFCNSLILDSETLTIPHPMLHLRVFTLEPLNEISPELIHPKLQKSIEQLLKDLGAHNNKAFN